MYLPKAIFLFPLLASGFIGQKPLGQIDTHDQTPLSEAERSQLHDLHRNLVNIESITGNEKSVGNWLVSYLKSHDLTVEKQHVTDDRFNIIAYPGDHRHTRILVTSHLDTVPPFIPYTLNHNGTEAWGRGSVDAKSCVAAQTMAVLRLLSRARTSGAAPPSLSLLFVVGEERGGDGMRHFSGTAPGNYGAVVFGEPTEGQLARGHKGMLTLELAVRGRAAHSGYPWLGLSATALLVRALDRLLALERELPASRKFGRSTVNVGSVRGGVAPNVVAAEAAAEVAIRIAAGEPQKVREAVDAALAPVVREAERSGGSVVARYSNRAYGPVDIDADIPGFATTVVNYGTDIPNLLLEGHKKYLYGPGSIHLAHGPDEHLKLRELEDAVIAYEKIISHQSNLLGPQHVA